MNRLALRDKARRQIFKTRAAELAYVLSLLGIFGAFQAAIMAMMRPHLVVGGLSGLDLHTALQHFLKQVPGKLGPAFDTMAARVKRDTADEEFPSSAGIDDAIHAAKESNVRLVGNAMGFFTQSVMAVLLDPANALKTPDELLSLLQGRAENSDLRARLIGTDQTLKLASALNRTRQMHAGIKDYTWAGMMDVKERASHVRLEGREFSWYGTTPIGYAPGEDYNCRCWAVPLR